MSHENFIALASYTQYYCKVHGFYFIDAFLLYDLAIWFICYSDVTLGCIGLNDFDKGKAYAQR